MKIQILHESGTYYVPLTSARLERLLKVSMFHIAVWWVSEVIVGSCTLSEAWDIAIWISVWTVLLLTDLFRCYSFSISNTRNIAYSILPLSLLSFFLCGGALVFSFVYLHSDDPLVLRNAEKVCSAIFAAPCLFEAIEGARILFKASRARFA
jgi:hypothetical protein